MKNKDLQNYLKQFPDNIDIKLLPNCNVPIINHGKGDGIIDLTEENILHTSEGAWVNDDVPHEEWDCEDGKIIHEGEMYLLFNPIIV